MYPSPGARGGDVGAAGAGGVRAALQRAEPARRRRAVALRLAARRPGRAAARVVLRARAARALLAQVRRRRARPGEAEVGPY